jgi:Peptidase MA superfamily
MTRFCLGLLACLLLGVLTLAGAAVPAHAQAGITASNAKVESKFADHITYSVTLKSDSDITAATVFVRYLTGDRSTSTTTRGKANFTPGKNVTATFTRPLTRGDLVPGTDIEYYWQVDNSGGQTLKTDTFKYSYPDDRFDFKSLSAPVGKGKMTVYWYGTNDAYGQDRLNVAVAAIERLQTQIGVELQTEAKVWIYRTRNDMLAALPFKGQTNEATLVTLGELAGPNTVLLLGGDPGVNNTTAHELSHLVVHLATNNLLIGGVSIPAWLDEGLSMYNQESVERGYTDALDRAIQANALISIQSMSSVPGQSDQVILFYGEAYSVVKYLNEKFGKEQMQKLLSVFKRGSAVDDALKEVYGFGIQELESRWRSTLGAPVSSAATAAPQPTAPAGAVAQNTPAPVNTPAPSALPFSCACLSGFAFVFLWWLIRRH